MATRSKKGSTTKSPTTRKRSSKSAKIAEEMQAVGADILPTVTVTVEGSRHAAKPTDVPQELPQPQVEAKSSEAKTSEARTADVKTVEAKTADVKTAEAKTVDVKSVDVKSVDVKSVDTKSVDVKSVETKSVDTKSVSTKSVDTKTPDAKSSDAPAVPQPEGRERGDKPEQFDEWDYHLFHEGTHLRLWEKFGAHPTRRDGVDGTAFAVWAPNAASVSVMGDFNEWNPDGFFLESRKESGVWEGFIPGVTKGATYKYHIRSKVNDYRVDKADPFGFRHEEPPQTASVVWDLDYDWQDQEWMETRGQRNGLHAPISIYEVHLGSWRRVPEEGNRSLTYREIAAPLAEYVKKMNFTHVELMPVMEHPFYGSWGYQITGYFAPTSRYGTPQDLMYLIDYLHQQGIAVILDWVPSHFPSDGHSLSYFDGTHLYEHPDPRKGFHPDWNSLIFNYGRNEVRSFLLSNAMYWLEEFHADGLRVDAVASMLYLDYSRKHGEWLPNQFGGRENIDAISFLRRLNEDIYNLHPDVQMIAEESTAWPMVSRPTYVGGLGFGLKWDMGWMHDSLRYFGFDPIHRKFHHNAITFRMMYAFSENFVLALSHDEVVHGKGSLIGKMPGDEWNRFANLRILLAWMYSQPGKKLLFMGDEFAQWREWNHDASLDWHLLMNERHAALQRWVEDLNKAYRDVRPLHELDASPDGFEWIDCCDTENSVASFIRRSETTPEDLVVVIFNFTPVPRRNYQIGMPRGGVWQEILNSDSVMYGGSGQGNLGSIEASPIPLHARNWSITLTLPPLAAVFLRSESEPTVDVPGIESATEEPLESESEA